VVVVATAVDTVVRFVVGSMVIVVVVVGALVVGVEVVVIVQGSLT
jgi:hypothetical protein